MKLKLVAMVATGMIALGLSGVVLAQYPPPAGNIVTTINNPNPAVGGESAFTVTVQSEAGVAAANVACTASIASQPGSDASVVPASFTTDSAGKANLTLKAGSAAGQVTVAIICGDLSATTVMTVGSGAPLPPDTGVGPGDESGSRQMLLLVLAAGMIAIGGAAVAYRRASSR